MRPPYPSYVTDRIRSIAQDTPTEEVGGVVVATPGAWRVIAIDNVSSNPEETYIPHGLGLINASKLGHLEFYWHTHINGNSNFSGTDITGIWETDIPWLLYNLPNDKITYFDPNQKTSLIARSWELGLTDCYSLVRDFYRWHLDIILPVPEHNGREKPWLDRHWNRAQERLPQHFTKIGLSKAQAYDVILFKTPHLNCNPAHVGILIPTSTGLQLLHHLRNQPSRLDPLFNPELVHSVWRTKHTISASNYLALWDVDLGAATTSKPPELIRVSAI